MRCGSCKGEGVTIEHVRSCYAKKNQDKKRPEPQSNVRKLPRRQVQLNILDPFKGIPNADGAEDYEPASRVVERSNERAQREGMPDVAQGYYALPAEEKKDFIFYRVDRPTEGKWTGYIFVSQVVGGNPRGFPVKPLSRARQVLKRILDMGEMESRALYGREIRRCTNPACHRTLTKKASRELGLGPVCAENMSFGETWRELDDKFNHEDADD